MSLPLSGSQTVGPFFAIGLEHLVPSASSEEGVWEIGGAVLDAEGTPVPDAMVEVWHADANGHYDTSSASGFVRIPTSAAGEFRFSTPLPGSVTYDTERMQAPHVLVLVFMRGLLRNMVTRMYFPDQPGNANDPVLQLVPAERRSTLIAHPAGPNMLHWNIVLRGDAETVFFAW